MGNELRGKVAIVTGGAAGIGRAIVGKFLEEGAQVVIADIDRETGQAAAAELGSDVAFVETDVSKSEQVEALVASAVETFGGLHIMVNNAGIPAGMSTRFFDDDLADFHRVMDVDLLGVLLGTQHAGRHMAANGGGSVINISSIAGVQAGCSQWSYRAAKAGVVHFTKCVAIDLGKENVRVNCIAPGSILTGILATATDQLGEGNGEVTQKIREVMQSMRPLQQDGMPDDIAEATLYLAGERSKYVTGTALPVDGGMTAGYPHNNLEALSGSTDKG